MRMLRKARYSPYCAKVLLFNVASRNCSSKENLGNDILKTTAVGLDKQKFSTTVATPKRPDNSGSEINLQDPQGVETVFYNSVVDRTVSNAQVRSYILSIESKDFLLALAAVKGAKKGGLKINSFTYEALLNKLIDAGQLKAAMTLYQQMLEQHMTPTSKTYALIMKLCLQRDMPESCQRLYKEMRKRGVQPSEEAYSILIQSLAIEVPSKWQDAIEVFDKMNRDKHVTVTAETYNSLMRVYLNMRPFDWRVVYNCYYEMRYHDPFIPINWESYLILAEALRNGNAGRIRRAIVYFDAWVAVTPIWSFNFLKGALFYAFIVIVLKMAVSKLIVDKYSSSTSDSLFC